MVLKVRRKRRKKTNIQKVLVHNREMKQNFTAETDYTFFCFEMLPVMDKEEEKRCVHVGVGERTLFFCVH